MSRVLAAVSGVLMLTILALVILMSCAVVAPSVWGAASLFGLSVVAGVLANLSNRSLKAALPS